MMLEEQIHVPDFTKQVINTAQPYSNSVSQRPNDEMLYGSLHPLSHAFPYYFPPYYSEQMWPHQIKPTMPFPTSLPIQNMTSTFREMNHIPINNYEQYSAREVSSDESDKDSENDEIQLTTSKQPTKMLHESDLYIDTTQKDYSEAPNTTPTDKVRRSRQVPKTIKDVTKKRRDRISYTSDQIEALEKMYTETAYPDATQMESLAADLDITPARIKVWFQNKRAKCRKTTKEKPIRKSKCDSVVPCTTVDSYHPHHMLHGVPAEAITGTLMHPKQPFQTSEWEFGNHFTSTNRQTFASSKAANSPIPLTPSPHASNISSESSDGSSACSDSHSVSSSSQTNFQTFPPYTSLNFDDGTTHPKYGQPYM